MGYSDLILLIAVMGYFLQTYCVEASVIPAPRPQSDCVIDPPFEDCELLTTGLTNATAKKCLIVPEQAFPNFGCSCRGMELPGSGPGPRNFEILCTPSSGLALRCNYRGNPHHCPAYNEGGQSRFYAQLLTEIGFNMCQPPVGNCPNRANGYFAPMCQNCDRSNFFYGTLV